MPLLTPVASTIPTALAQGLGNPVAVGSPPSPPPGSKIPPLVGADLRVPTRQGDRVYGNLDHAASTPALVAVKRAVDRTLETYASVHRGAGWASQVTSTWYERARDEVAGFVGARATDEVVFTRTTTDSWNLLARALPEDALVFVFDSEHHSTLLPWQAKRTVRLPVPGGAEDAVALLDHALDAHPAAVRLVVLTAASNVTGEIWPVARFAELAHSHGARIAVDAAQLAAHRAVDLAAWDADYVAFSGHKVYAPFGAGVLAGRQDWLDAGDPYLAGGGATRSVSQLSTSWQSGPARHEGGSPNVVGAVALAAAGATLALNRTALEAHETRLLDRLRAGLAAVPGTRQLSIFDEDADRVGVVTFTVPGYDPSLVSQVLSWEQGIGVRDGRFCAHLLVDRLLGARQPLTTAVRASIGLGTTEEAVDRLVAGVRRLVESGPLDEWTHHASGWRLATDPRDAGAAPAPW
ncbi:aminotransferase class V-fold PLP-dependent enzyme [Intrasporangium sp.]|uniref:aminotransferase class V-fold PLP-dependent enzyme n=1 Tax=Intrasporangium sp. TaxID=1925024 RepID=UPI0032219199